MQCISLRARGELGAGAQLARDIQQHICLYPSDEKIGMKRFGKTLELVLSVDLTHVCGFIECFGRSIVSSCRKAGTHLTKRTRMLLNIRNASLAAVA